MSLGGGFERQNSPLAQLRLFIRWNRIESLIVWVGRRNVLMAGRREILWPKAGAPLSCAFSQLGLRPSRAQTADRQPVELCPIVFPSVESILAYWPPDERGENYCMRRRPINHRARRWRILWLQSCNKAAGELLCELKDHRSNRRRVSTNDPLEVAPGGCISTGAEAETETETETTIRWTRRKTTSNHSAKQQRDLINGPSPSTLWRRRPRVWPAARAAHN